LAKNPVLKEMIGDDIITADGTHLLGSDDKSGCARDHDHDRYPSSEPHNQTWRARIAFTPDEEVGRWQSTSLTFKAFGASVAYTVDGETLGEISNETWSAQDCNGDVQRKKLPIPGTAKGIMVNSLFAIADYLSGFLTTCCLRQPKNAFGFVHPYTGGTGSRTIVVEDSLA
jgi:tripeptide aminopeptidase